MKSKLLVLAATALCTVGLMSVANVADAGYRYCRWVPGHYTYNGYWVPGHKVCYRVHRHRCGAHGCYRY